jgi:hypothetical protein
MLERRLWPERDKQVAGVVALGSIGLDQLETEVGEDAADPFEPAAVVLKARGAWIGRIATSTIACRSAAVTAAERSSVARCPRPLRMCTSPALAV